MRRVEGFYLLVVASIFVLSGCVVRTYPLTKDRVDQDLTMGNRGYLKGAVIGEEREKKTTRTTQAVEIEFYPLIRFEGMQKPAPMPKEEMSSEVVPKELTEDLSLEGNRGYITQSEIPETPQREALPAFEKYTVQKGDTLQKISKKFFGTTKKWNKIFEANQEALKGPNKIYPGQVLNIPVEPLKEPQQNLK